MEAEITQLLRVLTSSGRGGDASLVDESGAVETVMKLHALCAKANSQETIQRVFPVLAKLFQRTAASNALAPTKPLLLLALLQFFIDYEDTALHDLVESLRTFFRASLYRHYADPVVALATVNFLLKNKLKLLTLNPGLLPQYFPLLLKLLVWGGPELDRPFLHLFSALVSPNSFLALFPALLDLPTLVLALEDVERTTGSPPGSVSSSTLKNPAPEALFAMMDAAYTGSVAADEPGPAAEVGAERGGRGVVQALFKQLLREENQQLQESYWSKPGLADALKLAKGTATSARLEHAFNVVPSLLRIYFALALSDVEDDALLSALLSMMISRTDALFPDVSYQAEVRRSCVNAMLAILQRSPHIVATLKKPIIDTIGHVFYTPAKVELALHLCWAVGEHGGGGRDHRDAAQALFESLELLIYESLATSAAQARAGIVDVVDVAHNKEGRTPASALRSRVLCVGVTAIAKLATWHHDLTPRARVCLTKVARSQRAVDRRVWAHAEQYLRVMQEPAMCAALLTPLLLTSPSCPPTTHLALSSLPFYLLSDKEGPPFHDFSMADLIKPVSLSQERD